MLFEDHRYPSPGHLPKCSGSTAHGVGTSGPAPLLNSFVMQMSRLWESSGSRSDRAASAACFTCSAGGPIFAKHDRSTCAYHVLVIFISFRQARWPFLSLRCTALPPPAPHQPQHQQQMCNMSTNRATKTSTSSKSAITSSATSSMTRSTTSSAGATPASSSASSTTTATAPPKPAATPASSTTTTTATATAPPNQQQHQHHQQQ